MNFQRKLNAAIDSNNSLLCIGLDPDPELMPPGLGVTEFNAAIVDATHDLVCAYKPNFAFYDALDNGHSILHQTINHIREVAPNIPIIGDSKRGDVRSTSVKHAKALFDVFRFDAATINPYGGHDAVQPFLDYSDKGLFIWCRSSNPGAREIQDLWVTRTPDEPAHRLYERIAILASEWNTEGNVGLVAGAPHPEELQRVRELCPNMPILIPGVGAQQGPLGKAVAYGVDHKGSNAIINVSRSILYASEDPDIFTQKARKVAQEMCEFIEQSRKFAIVA